MWGERYNIALILLEVGTNVYVYSHWLGEPSCFLDQEAMDTFENLPGKCRGASWQGGWPTKPSSLGRRKGSWTELELGLASMTIY